jgi:tRNA threonylcarbamoyladenosine biosynthesis protein TsaE
MKLLSTSLKDTQDFAAQFLERVLGSKNKTNNTKSATVICLSGDLGSGKTAFVQAVARLLGIEQNVTSPTFVIEKIYSIVPEINATMKSIPSGRIVTKFTHLIHIDAYRLEKGGKELKVLDWGEIIADPTNLICIEWPEKVADILPKDALKLSFVFIDAHTREITYSDSFIGCSFIEP